MTPRLALVLISGGLDSILATRLAAELPDITVIGYYFRHPFENELLRNGLSAAERAAFTACVSIIEESDDASFFDMIINAKLGRGKGANPCRDCRLFILRKAAAMLEKLGGDFLITGEVVGQRPMSQLRNHLNQIENLSGIKGLIVRPLCGKLLPPTIPEKRGWIKRESFFDFQGRNRKPQIELAHKLGIFDFPNPAGGCILTQAAYAKRFFDLMKSGDKIDAKQLSLLRFGRHYRLPSGLKFLIPRDEAESERALDIAAGQLYILTYNDIPGPIAILNRAPVADETTTAAVLLASYGKLRKSNVVSMKIEVPDGTITKFSVKPANKEYFRDYLIA